MNNDGNLDQLVYSKIVNKKYDGSKGWPDKVQSQKLIDSLTEYIK